MKRYSTILLFQFRVDVPNTVMHTCLKQMFLLQARNASSALRKARARGHKAEYSYLNSDGRKVFFELVGVLDLLCLDQICEDDEVWYSRVDIKTPMKRKHKLLTSDESLLDRAS